MNRLTAVVIIHVIGCAVAIFIQAIVSQWMDIVSIYICPLGALLAGVMFFWIANREFAEEAVNLGAPHKIGGWFYPAGKYLYCALAFIALIAGAIFGGIG